MKTKLMLVTLAPLVLLTFIACGERENENEAAEATVQEALQRPVPVEDGIYKGTIECADAAKTKTLGSYEMAFDLKADRSYRQRVMQATDEGTTTFTNIEGTYAPTEGFFTFHQKRNLDPIHQNDKSRNNSADNSQSRFQESGAAKTKRLNVVSYATGKIVLMDESIDNACNGKMTLVLTKQ